MKFPAQAGQYVLLKVPEILLVSRETPRSWKVISISEEAVKVWRRDGNLNIGAWIRDDVVEFMRWRADTGEDEEVFSFELFPGGIVYTSWNLTNRPFSEVLCAHRHTWSPVL